jgi:UDPglucose 6-dehydrogenase
LTDRDDADPSIIIRAVERIAPMLAPHARVVVESQVPVGTCRTLRRLLKTKSSNGGIDVAYVPENLRLGQAIDGYLRPDMLIIGADDPSAHDVSEQLFAGVDAPRIRTDLATAEMTKHAINAFLATSISFANELANVCQTQGVDAATLISILRRDRRVGSQVPLSPGMGFAGGTLARDVKALTAVARTAGYDPRLLDAVLEVNSEQKTLPVRWLRQMHGTLRGVRVAMFGLTYKPGTSTLRRSDALPVIRQLVGDGATVTVVDPQADLTEVRDLPPFEFTRDAYEAVEGADALIVMTPWPEFASLDYERVHTTMRRPIILDMPNALDRERLAQLGFVYVGVGRGAVPRLSRS